MRMTKVFNSIAILTALSLSNQTYAQVYNANLSTTGDERGKPEITICSQNLHMYGAVEELKLKGAPVENLAERTAGLASRFTEAECDIIAVQELIGRSSETALKGLGILAAELTKRTNKRYELKVGPSGEGNMTLGFIVAKGKGDIVNVTSYDKVELPKLSEKQRPRLFSRGPLELQFMARGVEGSTEKAITLVNMHLKSKHGARGDPAGLEWETFRMEMAEGLRRVVETRHEKSFASGQSILVILGDRNSDFDSASAKILEGTLFLKNFQENGTCRLSKQAVPLCRAESAAPQRLFSVLTTNPYSRNIPGTYLYKKEYSWLDDIIMPAESLPFAWRTATSEGEYESGVVTEPKGASDHALVYMRLNW